MWMVVSHAGTKKATRFVLDVCTKDVTMVTYCKEAMIKLSLSAVPSAEIIDKMIVSLFIHSPP